MAHRTKRPPAGRRPAAKAFDAYPRPSVAVDVVCLTVAHGEVSVLLYERAIAPQKGALALPGGFVQVDEALDAAAARLLRDKAGLEGVYIEQLRTFGEPKRDPRGRVITVAYVALLDAARFSSASALKRPVRVPWKGTMGGAVEIHEEGGRRRELFLDHALIIGVAIERLRAQLGDTPIGFALLPPEFTLRELQEVHEAIRGERVNKDSFRRRLLQTGFLEATGAREDAVLHRPAELYRRRQR
jgi:8-oxo-dGTP diphosphatase